MKRYLFNDGWTFVNGSGSALSALMGRPPESRPVTLPHDCVIGTERVEDPAYASLGFYKGANVHYTKSFDVPAEWTDKTLVLEFEGVYQMAYVYVNNAYAGQCMYGYGNYYVDITNFVKAGKNDLKVVVKNAPPSGRWYTGGGIYRDVQLYVGDQMHICCEGTRVYTEDLEEDQAVLQTVAPVENCGGAVKDVVLVNEVLDARGQVVSAAKAPVTVLPHEKKDVRLRMVVPNPAPWDEDHPNLYTIRTTLSAGDGTADECTDTFGIRKLQLDVKKGLRVNGKTVKLRGGCIHHDSGVLGAATFENAEERRVRKLKEAGYNAIRSAHHPMGKALLRACDKLGMYVMDEFSDVWTTTKAEFDYGMRFAACWERDVTNMVLKDFNHPSVILYSIGNEIPETGNKFDTGWGKKLADRIRQLDGTRYVMNSVNLMLSVMSRMDEIMASFGVQKGGGEINSLMTEMNGAAGDMGNMMGALANHPIASSATEEAFAQVDIAGYNYAEDRYEEDLERFPNRILIGSETTPAKLAKNWALVEKMPNVLGDFVWTAWDYLGESGIGAVHYEGDPASFMGQFPWRIAYCGTIDINGHRQPVSYWREIVWGRRKAPYLSVCPPENHDRKLVQGMWGWSDSLESWNWPGFEGKPITVEVYADGDEVELFVNGRSVGVKKPGGETPYVARFETVYTPGEVKAVCRKDGETLEYAVRSAGQRTILTVEAEQQELKAGVEVGFVNITVTDEDGVCDPSRRVPVKVTVTGGQLAGLGSGDPTSNENFQADSCVTFGGRALAVVRACEAGEMAVTVEADGYAPKTVRIQVKSQG